MSQYIIYIIIFVSLLIAVSIQYTLNRIFVELVKMNKKLDNREGNHRL